MNNLLLLILLSLILYYVFYVRKEKLNNTANIKLDKRIRNLDNENKIIKEITNVKEDEIKKSDSDDNIKYIHPYPDSSQDFIYVYNLNDALSRSNFIDDAHNLMIGELRQNLTEDQLKQIQGKIKNKNVKNKMKLFNPVFYRFGQHYYNFQDIDDHIIKPNYKIIANYL